VPKLPVRAEVTVVRRAPVLAVALATVCALFAPIAAGGSPSRARAEADDPVDGDTIIGHPDDDKLTPLTEGVVSGAEERSTEATESEAAVAAEIGEERTWAALDDFNGFEYLKDYTLRGVGEHIEVWVASDSDDVSSDLEFPGDDCRNDERVVITDEQIQGLIAEYDGNILPIESQAFSVAPDRDGTNAILPEAIGLPADYYTGEGDNVVVLVDNVRDTNFYDPSLAGGNVTYIAGFFYSVFNEYFDRNVMTIDGYDWVHRTGPNPPDEPVPGDLCASKPARPFTYEGTFAHEYQHLLQYYADAAETSWVNEGLSMYAEEITGYATADLPITELGFDAYIQCLLGNSEIQTEPNPNPREGGPENSLTLWGDQGQDSEILCDYGAAFSFMLYLDGRFGPGFLTALHNDGARQGLASLQGLLDERVDKAPSAQTLLHQWAAMLALDEPLETATSTVGIGSTAGYSTPTLHAAINWDNDDAYAEPGAPPNGSDYVRLRAADGSYLSGSDVQTISFDGASLLPTTPVEWTVDPSPPGQEGDPALWSGSGENFDRAAIVGVSVPTTDATLTFDTTYDTEVDWDFGFVQVSTDGGATWTSLANELTTDVHNPGAVPAVIDNLPGISGTSDGWVSTSFDLSAYAGQDVLLSFRYITDSSVNGDGWWIDDVAIGGEVISDGSSVEGFQSQSEVLPTAVAGFTVQIVGYNSAGGGTVARFTLGLDDSFDGGRTRFPKSVTPAQVASFDVVAAIVMYDEPTESVTQYAPYVLSVNGVVQPGGGSEAPAA
jgi:hypothetical protein